MRDKLILENAPAFPRPAKRSKKAGCVSAIETGADEWRIWQLADSAFPTGGFAHSGGLEAARQQGEIRNRSELDGWLKASLSQLARAALPFVRLAHVHPERFAELDGRCHAFLSNHVANRASRRQGQALLTAGERIFRLLPPGGVNGGECIVEQSAAGSTYRREDAGARRFYAHLAPVFGYVLGSLNVPATTTLRLFVFQHLRGWVASAVRMNVVGPLEGQAIQAQLAEAAETAVRRGLTLSLDDVANTAPLLDLWQGTQDRLYTRLFQS